MLYHDDVVGQRREHAGDIFPRQLAVTASGAGQERRRLADDRRQLLGTATDDIERRPGPLELLDGKRQQTRPKLMHMVAALGEP